MQCPKCHHMDTKVIDSRPEREGRSIRRRRACDACHFRFSTTERIHTGGLMVRKSDGRVENFSPEKLEQSMLLACGKRAISHDQIREIVRDLSEDIAGKTEIKSQDIGQSAMSALKKLDHIAYIRFASVYRQFHDVEDFKREIGELFQEESRGDTKM